MSYVLIIVESPAKIAKLESFLKNHNDTDYKIVASYGSVYDLDPKSMSIDFENKYEPFYTLKESNKLMKTNYKEISSNIKSLSLKASKTLVASDPDLEGTSLGYNIVNMLKIKNYKRISFTEISQKAIINAVDNPREFDMNEINAQKCRRVVDRLIGYLLSPLVSSMFNGSLSAGRCQSVVLKLIQEREDEIKDFFTKEDSSYFKISGNFVHKKNKFKAILFKENKICKIIENDEVLKFLKNASKSLFTVNNITEKISTLKPSEPFETSTLQQEAFRKLGMDIKRTMTTAQKLYEKGLITYMRTDSTNISVDAMKKIKKTVIENYGEEYYQENIYKTKSASAQEAHECIRITDPKVKYIDIDSDLNKLYSLIWKRTISSQMSNAKIKNIIIDIEISKYAELDYYFQAISKKIIFDGFLKVYLEGKDDEDDENLEEFIGKIPKIGDEIEMIDITANQLYEKPPSRYVASSLVNILKKKGIGRPSTYVTMIDTNFTKKYMEIKDIKGVKKEVINYSIKTSIPKKIEIEETFISLGEEKKKIVPTTIGTQIITFLLKHFSTEISYDFTSNMETQMDEIAKGNLIWYKIVDKFYKQLLPKIDELKVNMKDIKNNNINARLLGKDDDGNEIYALTTKNGDAVSKKVNNKSIYGNITDPYSIDTITLKQALKLFPKVIGQHNDKDIILKRGKENSYLEYNNKTYSIEGDKIKLNEAIEIIKEKDKSDLGEKTLTYNSKKITVLFKTGQYGNYFVVKDSKKKKCYSIPKDIEIKKITEQEIIDILNKPKPVFKKKFTKK